MSGSFCAATLRKVRVKVSIGVCEIVIDFRSRIGYCCRMPDIERDPKSQSGGMGHLLNAVTTKLTDYYYCDGDGCAARTIGLATGDGWWLFRDILLCPKCVDNICPMLLYGNCSVCDGGCACLT